MPAVAPKGFDWCIPDYMPVFRERLSRLQHIRQEPDLLPGLRGFYKDNPAQFIMDFGCTFDPRLVSRYLPAVVPFILFPRQVEWIDETVDHWKNQRSAATVKTRDMGISWLSIALGCTLCIFNRGMAIGYGSRKEEYVDRIGAPKSLFYKARMFLENLPVEFRAGHNFKVDAPHMRIGFPEMGSFMSGEAGDNIGRGDRASIYFVDESAFLERPQLIEASLSNTTNCRQDISTPRGMNNPFATRVHSGNVPVFRFHWRDDPRKATDFLGYELNGRKVCWYEYMCGTLDPVSLAQEVDMDFSASVEGVLIPSAWVQAAVGAHAALGIKVTGTKTGALDVADQGADKNAFVGGQGILLSVAETWSGIGGDIFKTVQRAFHIADRENIEKFRYDGDGLGAGVRGDARMINESRSKKLVVDVYRGSNAVANPKGQDVPGSVNEDFFQNTKAQAYWNLRVKFQRTFRAVKEGLVVDPDTIISIDPNLPELKQLCNELSQPTYKINDAGRVQVEKQPEGSKSPNLADATVMWAFGQRKPAMKISREARSKA